MIVHWIYICQLYSFLDQRIRLFFARFTLILLRKQGVIEALEPLEV